MSPTPLVSIILPTYNRAKTLERAVRSVLNQTFGDFELIIVDDGSTDQSSLVLGKYSGLSNIRLISSIHRGCSAARNLGVAASRGSLIAFQDSDDEWLPDKLEKAVVALADAGQETGIFYSDMIRVEEDGSYADFKSPDVRRGVLINDDTLDYQVRCIGIQSAVIKRKCFDVVGLFDEALPRLIDLELFIRISDHFEFLHHKEPLVKFFATKGISTDTEGLVIARRYLIKKYRLRLKLRKHYLARQYLLLSLALYENGNKYKSRAFAIRAMLTSPYDLRIRRQALDILEAKDDSEFIKAFNTSNNSFEPNAR